MFHLNKYQKYFLLMQKNKIQNFKLHLDEDIQRWDQLQRFFFSFLMSTFPWNRIGGNFSRWGNEQILASGGTLPVNKTLLIVVLPAVGTCITGESIFDTHLKTGKQRHDSSQETKQLRCWKPNRIHFFSIRVCSLWYQMPFVNL